MLKEVVALVPCWVALMIPIIIQADERDGVRVGSAIILPSVGIAREHAQPIWECSDFAISSSTREIVCVDECDWDCLVSLIGRAGNSIVVVSSSLTCRLILRRSCRWTAG